MPIAIRMHEYGAPQVLRAEEIEAWTPGPGEIVLRNAIVGVNRADAFIRKGEWRQGGGFPYVPGLEACGVVERVGEGVDDVRIGDAVITMMQKLGGIHGTRPGGYQELVRVPASTVARIPAGIDARTIGALGLPAVTAFGALEALDVRPGMRVLVHAGSSAVGTMALQLLRARGIESVATGTRREKFALVESCGASKVVSTKDADWPENVGEIDRVFDLVGQATFAASVASLRAGGRLVFVGGTSGGDLSLSGWDLMRPTTLTGWSSESMTRDDLQRAIDAIAAESIADRLRVAELHAFPLRDAAAAHAAMEAGTLAGRIVLDPRAGRR
jgi:NADPH2:quinone reductase